MIGRIKLSGSGGGSITNGVLQTFTVTTGQTVAKGDFVKQDTSTRVSRAVSGDTILGVSKNSGSGGDTVQVFVLDTSG